MLQDIAPHRFHNEFTPRKPEQNDYVLMFDEQMVWFRKVGNTYKIPTYEQVKEEVMNESDDPIYLFSIDEHAFFLLLEDKQELPEFYEKKIIRFFREFKPRWLGFAGVTGSHLRTWYKHHKYCGRCAGKNGTQR